jgi:hypothetical protein
MFDLNQILRPFTGVSAAGGIRPMLQHGLAERGAFSPLFLSPAAAEAAAGLRNTWVEDGTMQSLQPNVNVGSNTACGGQVP